MSSALEDRAQVAAMLAEEGVAVVITRTPSGAYDPGSGSSASAGAPQNFGGRARFGNYSDRLVDGTLIRQGDRRVTFQPTDWSFVPQVGDVFTQPAGYSIAGPVRERELGGVPIEYTLQVRK